MQKQLLKTIKHKQLHPLNIQFTLTITKNKHPTITLTTTLLNHNTKKKHIYLPLSQLKNNKTSHPLLTTYINKINKLQN